MTGHHAAEPNTTTAGGADAPLSLVFAAGNPSPVEIAAITAVATAALDELADDDGVEPAPAASAWQRSQRPIRGALHPGPGVWRGFTG